MRHFHLSNNLVEEVPPCGFSLSSLGVPGVPVCRLACVLRCEPVQCDARTRLAVTVSPRIRQSDCAAASLP